MTDIVEWLRTTPRRQGMDFEFVGRLNEAADTIEQLRDMLQRLMDVRGAARIGPSFAEITKDIPRRRIEQDPRIDKIMPSTGRIGS